MRPWFILYHVSMFAGYINMKSWWIYLPLPSTTFPARTYLTPSCTDWGSWRWWTLGLSTSTKSWKHHDLWEDAEMESVLVYLARGYSLDLDPDWGLSDSQVSCLRMVYMPGKSHFWNSNREFFSFRTSSYYFSEKNPNYSTLWQVLGKVA